MVERKWVVIKMKEGKEGNAREGREWKVKKGRLILVKGLGK